MVIEDIKVFQVVGVERSGLHAPMFSRYRGKPAWAMDIDSVEIKPINLTEVAGTMKKRNNLRIQQCNQLQQEDQIINNEEFVINDRYRLAWCSIFKSASSTWFYNFFLLAGFRRELLARSRSTPVQFARETAYPRPSEYELATALRKNYTSFIIVREPFERILSGYRDKIEADVPFYRPLVCQIAGKLGKRKGCFATFSQFVDYIIEEIKNENPLNEHWSPYSSFCSVCVINYTFVLHFETLSEDESYLIQQVRSTFPLL